MKLSNEFPDLRFPVTMNPEPKKKPTDESKLGFGKIFTDHMFIMDWDRGRGWHDGRIVPFGPIPVTSPPLTLPPTLRLTQVLSLPPTPCDPLFEH